MKLVYSLKLLSDLLFYLSFAGLISTLASSGNLFDSLLFFVPCVVLLGTLADAKWLKYVALVLLIPAALNALNYSLIQLGFLVPAIIYVIYYAASLPYDVKRVKYSGVFKVYMLLSLFVAFLFVVWFPIPYIVSSVTIPYTIMFGASAVALMHMIRHDAVILTHTKFKVMSILSVVGVFLLGAALGNEWVIQAALRFLSSPYVISALIVIAFCVLIVFLKRQKFEFLKLVKSFPLFRLLGAAAGVAVSLAAMFWLIREVEEVEIPFYCGCYYCVCYYCECLTYGVTQNIWLIILGVVVFSFLALAVTYLGVVLCEFVKMLYKLWKEERAVRENSPEFERVILGDDESLIRVQKSKNDNEIRRVYRKFLKLCKLNRVVIEPSSTTIDIAKNFGHMTGEHDKALALREIYVDVRYGEKDIEAEDIKESKAIYKKLK